VVAIFRGRHFHSGGQRPLWCLWLTVLVLVSDTTNADGQSGEDELSAARVLLEYRRGVVKQQTAFGDACVDGVMHSRRYRLDSPRKKSDGAPPQDDPRIGTLAFSYCRSGDKEKVDITNPDRGSGRVYVNAGSRRFRLRRASPGGPYALDDIADTSESWDMFQLFRARVKDAAYCVGGLSRFPSYVQDSAFHVVSVSRTFESGKSVVKLQFQYRPSPNGSPTIDGWMCLDPTINWAIRSCDVVHTVTDRNREKVSSHFSGAIAYLSVDSVAVPSEIKYKNVRNNKTVEEVVYEIHSFVRGPAAAGAFELAAFGLGDFEQLTRQNPNRVAYYAAALGGAALLISLLLSWWARHAQRGRSAGGNLSVGVTDAGRDRVERRFGEGRDLGFTLVELLVALSIVSLLFGLLLPGLQSARESIRRAQCSNNMRQFGLALQSYHDVFGSLPPGRIKSYDPRYAGPRPPCTSSIVDKGLEVFALGFMEQATLYNAINQSLAVVGAENGTVHAIAVSTFACPSDTMSGWPRSLNPGDLRQYGIADPARMVFTSYAGMIGSLPVLAQPLPSTNCVVPGALIAQCNGVFNDLSPIHLASVTDGLSNTIFMAEKATTILQELNALNPQYAAQHGWYITGNWGDEPAPVLRHQHQLIHVTPPQLRNYGNPYREGSRISSVQAQNKPDRERRRSWGGLA
jgi:prepilin-type N-terminal cleavage/methylation domain-containing protein